jgi:hypothetical protein
VHRALDVDPHGRFPSARAMAQELASVLAGTLGEGRDAQSLLGRAVSEARKPVDPRPGVMTPTDASLEITVTGPDALLKRG